MFPDSNCRENLRPAPYPHQKVVRLFQSREFGRERKRPSGGYQSPKGRIFHSQIRAGIPAPRCSRRESPINRTRHYPAGANGVKAILARLTGDTPNIAAPAARPAEPPEVFPSGGVPSCRGADGEFFLLLGGEVSYNYSYALCDLSPALILASAHKRPGAAGAGPWRLCAATRVAGCPVADGERRGFLFAGRPEEGPRDARA